VGAEKLTGVIRQACVRLAGGGWRVVGGGCPCLGAKGKFSEYAQASLEYAQREYAKRSRAQVRTSVWGWGVLHREA